MTLDAETTGGIKYPREIFESSRILELGDPKDLTRNGFSPHFVVSAYDKQWGFSVTRQQLSDLPSMPEYCRSAVELALTLERRFKNISPDIFRTASGQPIRIEIVWPIQPLVGRATSCLEARIFDARTKGFAHCYVIITPQQGIFELKDDPFQLHEAIVNSLRNAVDSGEMKFYPIASDHPREMQPVSLRFGSRAPSAVEMVAFLKQKVMQLGFRAANEETEVWITDPWDADYLNVQPNDLRQEAEILEAEHYMKLDESRKFARANHQLLIATRLQTQTAQRPLAGLGFPRHGRMHPSAT